MQDSAQDITALILRAAEQARQQTEHEPEPALSAPADWPIECTVGPGLDRDECGAAILVRLEQDRCSGTDQSADEHEEAGLPVPIAQPQPPGLRRHFIAHGD